MRGFRWHQAIFYFPAEICAGSLVKDSLFCMYCVGTTFYQREVSFCVYFEYQQIIYAITRPFLECWLTPHFPSDYHYNVT